MADIDLVFILLEIEVFFCATYAIIITVIAYSRYRQKTSQVTKIAFYMFFFIGNFSLSSGILFLLDPLGVKYLSSFNLIPPIFIMFVCYFMFTFARIVFGEEFEKIKLNLTVKVMLVIGIVLCVLRDFFLSPIQFYTFSLIYSVTFGWKRLRSLQQFLL